MHGSMYKPRVLVPKNVDDLAAELELIGATPEGIHRMLPKSRIYVFKLHNVPTQVAHVLKESFLSAGGDTAVDRRVMTELAVEHTDVILMGTRKHFALALRAINGEVIGGPSLAAELEAALAVYESGPIAPPSGANIGSSMHALFRSFSSRTVVMGILNVTPDSFSDGGSFLDPDAALAQGLKMAEDGAGVIDIGGESTRPGSDAVSAEDEIRRIVPVIKRLVSEIEVPISVDTYKASVAEAALDAGAEIINDISGMTFDPDMRRLVADRGCPIALMHIKGTPRDMQKNPTYTDLMGEIVGFLLDAIEEAVAAGVDEKMIAVDPGIGFGKTVDQNLTIIRRLTELRSLGRPILVGVSRKATIGHLLGDVPPQERVMGTAAAVTLSIANGADIVRVHDVKEIAQVAKVADAVVRG
jgi:dihydropteroate synthase